MRIKQLLALTLTLCLLLTAASPSAGAVSDWWSSHRSIRENIFFELLDGDLFDLNLFQNNWDTDLKIDKIDDDQVVKIFIIMDSLSVVETDRKATYNAKTQAMMDALSAEQAAVIDAIEQELLNGQTLPINYSYTWLLNGIAVQVPYDLVSKIAKIDGVKQVLLQPQYEVCQAEQNTADLMSVTSGTMIGRDDVWAGGYTGKGIKIAVIDTGLDDDHQNFQALPEEKLTEDSMGLEDIAALMDQLNATKLFNDQAAIDRTEMLTAEGLYRSTKVVYGFNYADKNLDITHDNDTMTDHGTHVSGIAAANKVEGSDVVGVAPDAQLLVFKVYGADHGGFAEDILAALEDALLLGVDVVNMSLGTNAGFTSGTEEVNAIYNRVSETGTVLSVASGNNYTSGFGNTWGDNKNQTMYPDNAVISQPSVYSNVLSVASVENLFYWRNYIAAGEEQIVFIETAPTYGLPAIATLEGEYPLVIVPKYGAKEDFEGLDLTGKIALIERGVETFGDKCQNAQAAGAIGCIIYNNVPDEFGMDLTGCTATIPCVSILRADGKKLISMLEENPELTVSFPKDEIPLTNPLSYQVSDFSSWGVAPDLSLEPDITAPGGYIYSTVMDGEYGVMSGTSMAAPHMAGLVALVMQYVRENNLETNLTPRELVQHLLVSTSTPLIHKDTGLYSSPRQQGSGLGNAMQAITTTAYLSVAGMDTPKAELGDDAAKTGSYQFSYQVHNFGKDTLYYRLSTTSQTEGFTTLEDHPDRLFMSGTPRGLLSDTAEISDALYLTHDLNHDGSNGSYDAYLLYLHTLEENASEGSDAFRYDINKDESVNMDDVQTYLNSLVGLVTKADMKDQVLRVPAGESVEVTVQVEMGFADKAYLDVYYPNGGYVEGFTFLEAVNGVDLSLPYLGFYGDWDAAPVLDNGFYWELLDANQVTDPEEPEDSEDDEDSERPEDPTDPTDPTDSTDPTDPTDPSDPGNGDEDGDFKDEEIEEDSKEKVIVGNQYANVLFTEFYGMPSTFYPGFNPYVTEDFDTSHISISPNGDGFVDTVDDIYISLLRNARYLTFRYVDIDTGEVYYDETVEFAHKSVYTPAYSQILPAIYSWMQDSIPLYDFVDSEGNTLANNTHLMLQVEAVGDYEGATSEMWEIPVTVDLEAPELLSVVKTTDPDGKVTLDLTFRDNLSVAAVLLMNSNGDEVYEREAVEDPEPDENGYRTYTASFDITDLTGKLMIALADYALNEAYFGMNLGGEGTAYGDLVGYQYNFDLETSGWVSFSQGVDKNEVQITLDEMDFESAEYVGGYVFAQTASGALYGFRYADMLLDRIDIETTFIAQLERSYHDLAYNYVTGELYGLTAYKDESGYPNTEIYTINIHGEYVDESTGETVKAYAETWKQGRSGLYALCITVDDQGTIYLLGTNNRDKTELWQSYESTYGTLFKKVMSIKDPMDYAQSITFDHNTSTLYWSQFYPNSIASFATNLFKIDIANGKYEKVGTLSGETCGLFAPLSAETIASNPVYENVPHMDGDIVGLPLLRKEVVNMNVGSREKLLYDFDPWYTLHRDVTWSSSDDSVVTVDEEGNITAVGIGAATITIASVKDPTLSDSCTVTVTELSLRIEGLISSLGSGVGNVGATTMYEFELDKGAPSFTAGSAIYAPKDLDFGLDIATSVMGRGYIWASEYGNTGMIYQIDPATGAVVDSLMPVNGDMLFGMTYNENLDTFTAIMNMYLFVDLALTHEEESLMMDSYDPATQSFNYHRINMLEYLLAAGGTFVTSETGQGASSEIVMCGITTITDSFHYVDTSLDFLGNTATDTVQYNATQTLVVLDNVGRLWYIDEICGLTKEADRLSTTYTSPTDEYTYISASSDKQRSGVIELDNGDGTYNVFYIRTIEETPMTDLFREDALPRITYHFSDIEFGGYTEDGAPIFVMSLYDYWNNGNTNELYLYVPEWTTYDEAAGSYVTKGEEKFYYLGDTGKNKIIASIHNFELIGGLDD